MRLLFAAAVLLLSACAPVTPAPAPSSPQTPEASCAAQGGRMMRVGRMQTEQCVLPYADAGKACAGGDDCEGQCIGEQAGGAPGTPMNGRCQAEHPMFGCFGLVEDERLSAVLCVD